MTAEIASNHVALPFIGKMSTANDFQSALLRLPRVHALEDAWQLIGEAAESSTRKCVIDAFAVSAIGSEALTPIVKYVAPGIDLTKSEHF